VHSGVGGRRALRSDRMLRMTTCWARELGDCSVKQSKEHPLSRSLLGKAPVTVSGLAWCMEPKAISVEGFGGNILCTAHNSQLSTLDDAGSHAFTCFGKFMQVRGVRLEERRKQRGVQGYRIDGGKLERWLLKAIIGTAFEHKTADHGTWQPSLKWVEMVFGRRPFPARCGLYIGDFRMSTLALETNRLAIRMLTRDEVEIDGAEFNLNGWLMVLSLAALEEHDITYQPPFIRDAQGLRLQQVISFDWPQT
jgi:hypothetical protein